MGNSKPSEIKSKSSSMELLQTRTDFVAIDEEIVKEHQQLRRHIQRKHERQVFTLFPKLAPGLKEMIIKAALDAEVRVVEVQVKQTEGRSTYRSRTLAPALMHTCSLTRNLAMSTYDRLPTSGVTPSFKYTFVNWEKDIIFFHTLANLRTFASGRPDLVKDKCQNLAIRLSDVGRFDDKVGWNRLRNIKKLVLLRQITNEPDKSKDLVVNDLPNPNWPGVHQSAMEAAATFLITSSDPSRALKDCVAMDASRDNEFKRKSYAKKGEKERARNNGKDTLSEPDALRDAWPEEEIAALGEKSELAGNPIFQDDFMNEGYITDDVLDDPLDEVKLVEFFEM